MAEGVPLPPPTASSWPPGDPRHSQTPESGVHCRAQTHGARTGRAEASRVGQSSGPTSARHKKGDNQAGTASQASGAGSPGFAETSGSGNSRSPCGTQTGSPPYAWSCGCTGGSGDSRDGETTRRFAQGNHAHFAASPSGRGGCKTSRSGCDGSVAGSRQASFARCRSGQGRRPRRRPGKAFRDSGDGDRGSKAHGCTGGRSYSSGHGQCRHRHGDCGPAGFLDFFWRSSNELFAEIGGTHGKCDRNT